MAGERLQALRADAARSAPALEETGYRPWEQRYDLCTRGQVTISALVVHLENLGISRVEGRRICEVAI